MIVPCVVSALKASTIFYVFVYQTIQVMNSILKAIKAKGFYLYCIQSCFKGTASLIPSLIDFISFLPAHLYGNMAVVKHVLTVYDYLCIKRSQKHFYISAVATFKVKY